jgi:hypothetical protein
MRQKLDAMSNFTTIKTTGDGLALLEAIKDTIYNF